VALLEFVNADCIVGVAMAGKDGWMTWNAVNGWCVEKDIFGVGFIDPDACTRSSTLAWFCVFVLLLFRFGGDQVATLCVASNTLSREKLHVVSLSLYNIASKHMLPLLVALHAGTK
jgi:hypothetical protein